MGCAAPRERFGVLTPSLPAPEGSVAKMADFLSMGPFDQAGVAIGIEAVAEGDGVAIG